MYILSSYNIEGIILTKIKIKIYFQNNLSIKFLLMIKKQDFVN